MVFCLSPFAAKNSSIPIRIPKMSSPLTILLRSASNLRSRLSLSRNLTTRSSVFDPSLSSDNAPSGLYGFDILKSPKDFSRFVDEAIHRYIKLSKSFHLSPAQIKILKKKKKIQIIYCFFRSGELISYISQLPPSIEIIRVMDEISDTVRVLDLSIVYCTC